jgi:hypothetical protein
MFANVERQSQAIAIDPANFSQVEHRKNAGVAAGEHRVRSTNELIVLGISHDLV